MNTESGYRLTPRLILGLFVLALGVLFTLDNLGIVRADDFLDLWPVVLIAVGVAKMLSAPHTGGWFGASVWILIGVVLLLDNLDLLDFDIFDFWPLILIVIGLGIIRRAMYPSRRGGAGTDDATVSGFALMGGQFRRVSSQEFRGGDLSAIMGGVEVDLRSADLPADQEAVIDVFAVWGGIDLRVPTSWTVISKVTPVMAGYEDHTDRTDTSPDKRLVVRGLILMGGVEVKN